MTETSERQAPPATTEIDQQTADALFARYIQQDPHHHGRHEAWVEADGAGVQVWVIVACLHGGYDLAQAADDYSLPQEAVTASIAYDERHRDLIDAKLLLANAAERALDAPVT